MRLLSYPNSQGSDYIWSSKTMMGLKKLASLELFTWWHLWELPWTCKVLLAARLLNWRWRKLANCLRQLGRLEVGYQAHSVAKCKIHIGFLDSFETSSSMCFCGPVVRLFTLVILPMYDRCLQTLGRLKLPLVTLNIFRCFSTFTRKARKGKSLVKQTKREKHWSNKLHQILQYPNATSHPL